MKPVIVEVDLPGSAYDVVIGNELLGELGARIRTAVRGKKLALVTDATVGDLIGIKVEAELVRGGFEVHGLTVAPGEASKNWHVAGQLVEAFASVGLDRTDAVVALGGGVVGDLAGFAAAVYLRGIEFAQVPTTLLAQVDSSVGGKTGVDLESGKNLAGAFKQPSIVVDDVSLLDSLPDAEWESGFAEIAKGAIVDSEAFTAWVESSAADLVAHERETVTEAVKRAVEFKARVVVADERESRERECLNYGHTLGHAIEKVAGYGVVRHGLAVAEGMRFAAGLALELAETTPEFVERQSAILDSLGLTRLDIELSPVELLKAMKSDKKSRGGNVRFVLATAPGQWEARAVPDDVIGRHLQARFAGE